MAHALRLAARGRYTTTPNPRVGCVILDANGHKVGEGFHAKAGEPHAEVHALRQAGSSVLGGCVYVTLEPCSHFGRTPPCADALVAARPARVVIAMQDPNPSVSGRGVQRLLEAGIDVVVGVMQQDAEALNRGFIKRMLTGKPYVTVKIGCSLDGKIALRNGVSQWITSDAARQDVQRLRAESCAVLTGSGTVLADNPSLLVRLAPSELSHDYPLQASRQPVRVVLDSQARLPSHLSVFSDGLPTLRATTVETDAKQDIRVNRRDEHLDLDHLMSLLGQQQFNEVLVEAGPTLAGAMMLSDNVDELVLYQAPLILGNEARSLAVLPDFQSLAASIRWQRVSTTMIGPDMKMVLKKVQ